MEQIIRLFPPRMREQIIASGVFGCAPEEIRVRVNEYLMFRTSEGERFLCEKKLVAEPNEFCVRMSREDLEQMCTFMSEYSLYVYEEELRQGFLTVQGGHRVGVCGQVSVENGNIRRIWPITYLNIRIAREFKGCARNMVPLLYRDGDFLDTLILSAPGIGKTTLLRDLVRMISVGGSRRRGKRVGLVDERSEIAGSIRGVPQNDVGFRTDVLDGCPKEKGMMLLVRSMSPEVLAVDEIGGKEDMDALRYAMRCGVRILATIHSRSLEELWAKPGWELCRNEKMFSRYLALDFVSGKRVFQAFDESGERIAGGGWTDGD